MECVILIGLPGVWQDDVLPERFAGTHDHVSKDAMRHNRQPQRRQERADRGGARRRPLRRGGQHESHRRRSRRDHCHRASPRRRGCRLFFPTEAADALRRNRAREGRDRVPAVAIFATRKRLEVPTYEEGFDRLFTVVVNEEARSFEVHRSRVKLATQLWLLRLQCDFRRARMRLFVSLVAILLMATAAVPRLQAQTTHAAPQSALDAAVQQHVDTTAADREAVLRVLGRSEVKRVAGTGGHRPAPGDGRGVDAAGRGSGARGGAGAAG